MAPRRAEHWDLDKSPSSALVICRACGARFIASTSPAVMVEMAEHLRASHVGEGMGEAARNAAATSRKARR